MQLLRIAMLLGVMLIGGSAVADEMPRPLGISLGSSLNEVRAKLAHKSLEQGGTSKYTRGPILLTDGADLQVSGLKAVTLVFNAEERLEALQMTLDAGGSGKPAFDRILGHLKQQYPVKSTQNPAVGNKFALFETKGARIELDSPHLSFEISATYMTKGFFQAFSRIKEEERKADSRKEKAQF